MTYASFVKFISKYFILFDVTNNFFLSFVFFRATPSAYGGSQARGWIGAVTAGLHHSHSNARCLLHIKLGWAGDWTCVPVLPRWHWSHWVRADILEFIFFFYFFFVFIFPLYSKGIKLSLHVYITFFFPTLCSVATWVSRHSSQCYSAGSPCKSIPSCVW